MMFKWITYAIYRDFVMNSKSTRNLYEFEIRFNEIDKMIAISSQPIFFSLIKYEWYVGKFKNPMSIIFEMMKIYVISMKSRFHRFFFCLWHWNIRIIIGKISFLIYWMGKICYFCIFFFYQAIIFTPANNQNGIRRRNKKYTQNH